VIDLAALEKMASDGDERGLDELRDYIVRRVRGDEANPPLAVARGETPEDFLEVVYGQTANEAFRARLGKAIVRALQHFARVPDLTTGADADAVRHLAKFAQWRNLQEAEAMLLSLAMRGFLGQGEREINTDAERAVLRALAKLQKPGAYFHLWERAWHSEDPALWPVATAGLRRSAPKKALRLLHEIVARAKGTPSFPLGEVLWAFRADPNVGPPGLSKEFESLDQDDRNRCREALRSVGASEEQIEELLPNARVANAGTIDVHAWAKGKREMPPVPPRLGVKLRPSEARP
jgi:hypothetical protein